MKTLNLRNVRNGVVALALLLFLANSARAALSWEAVGDTLTGNSWGHQFAAHGQAQTTFDSITAVVQSGGYTFESPGARSFTVGTSPNPLGTWASTSTSGATTTAGGDARNWVGWTFWFNGNAPANGNPSLELLLTASLHGVVVDQAVADYHINNNGEWVWQIRAVPVPEPTTIVAGVGALVLLLLGAGLHSKRSVLRIGK